MIFGFTAAALMQKIVAPKKIQINYQVEEEQVIGGNHDEEKCDRCTDC